MKLTFRTCFLQRVESIFPDLFFFGLEFGKKVTWQLIYAHNQLELKKFSPRLETSAIHEEKLNSCCLKN